jgi:cell division protein FtsL
MGRPIVGSCVFVTAGARKRAAVFPSLSWGRRPLFLLAFLFAIALFNVWLTGKHYKIGYAVSAALEERRTLQREQALLRTEILTLRSPARVEAIAKTELGMVEARTDRIIAVK